MMKKKSNNSMKNVLSIRDFKLLFAGVSTSLLGDQFTLIATPWLVLQLTKEPLALGIVLALQGIPRALFMLFGGAVTDRFSPRIIMLISDIVRLALVFLMAVFVFSGIVELWILYAFSLGFGLVAGFAVPAGNSIVPVIVKKKDLQAGNSIIMGTGQLAGFIGPFIAGVIIGNWSESLFGIGLAFSIDTLTFMVSALMMWLLKSGRKQKPVEEVTIITSILTGLKRVWHDKALRLVFIVIAAINFLFVGPVLIGVPVIADRYLLEGAFAFGMIMSGFAGGNLAGFIIAGVLSRPDGKKIKIIIIALLTVFGISLGAIGFIKSTWLIFGLMLFLGLGNGYVTIILLTWIQTRTPKKMLGRIMSFLMLSSAGLVPLSEALSGAVGSLSLKLLFLTAGGFILLVTGWTFFQRGLTEFSESISIKS
jgi:MFS family permease